MLVLLFPGGVPEDVPYLPLASAAQVLSIKATGPRQRKSVACQSGGRCTCRLMNGGHLPKRRYSDNGRRSRRGTKIVRFEEKKKRDLMIFGFPTADGSPPTDIR